MSAAQKKLKKAAALLEQKKVKEDEDAEKRSDPMWKALQGKGTALHKAQGLHGLDRETTKRWDFMHGASKEMLASIIRENGYQMPENKLDSWKPAGLRAYAKMQGINFIPNGYIVRTIGAAVKLQAAFRTFVVRNMIDKLKTEQQREKIEEQKQKMKKAVKNTKNLKAFGVLKTKNTDKPQENSQVPPLDSTPKESSKDAVLDNKRNKYITTTNKKDYEKIMADKIVDRINGVSDSTPKTSNILQIQDESRLNNLITTKTESKNSEDGSIDRVVYDPLQQKITKEKNHDSQVRQSYKVTEIENIKSIRVIENVVDGVNKSQPEVRTEEDNGPQPVNNKEMVFSDEQITEEEVQQTTPEEKKRTSSVRTRPRSALMSRNSHRTTLKPMLCVMHTSGPKGNDDDDEQLRIREAAFKKAILGSPSSAHASSKRNTSPSRFLSTRYRSHHERNHHRNERSNHQRTKPQEDDHRNQTQINHIQQYIDVTKVNEESIIDAPTWGEVLASDIVGAHLSQHITPKIGIRTVGISSSSAPSHGNIEEEDPFSHALPKNSGVRVGYLQRMSKYVSMHEKKSPLTVANEARMKIEELKQIRNNEALARQKHVDIVKTQYKNGGVIQNIAGDSPKLAYHGECPSGRHTRQPPNPFNLEKQNTSRRNRQRKNDSKNDYISMNHNNSSKNLSSPKNCHSKTHGSTNMKDTLPTNQTLSNNDDDGNEIAPISSAPPPTSVMSSKFYEPDSAKQFSISGWSDHPLDTLASPNINDFPASPFYLNTPPQSRRKKGKKHQH